MLETTPEEEEEDGVEENRRFTVDGEEEEIEALAVVVSFGNNLINLVTIIFWLSLDFCSGHFILTGFPGLQHPLKFQGFIIHRGNEMDLPILTMPFVPSKYTLHFWFSFY